MQQQPDFIKLKVGKSELLCKESANALTDQLLLIRDILVVYSLLLFNSPQIFYAVTVLLTG
jgi:hypothetical protein